MWNSKYFTQDQMTAWERLDNNDKTMGNIKTYFTTAHQDINGCIITGSRNDMARRHLKLCRDGSGRKLH